MVFTQELKHDAIVRLRSHLRGSSLLTVCMNIIGRDLEKIRKRHSVLIERRLASTYAEVESVFFVEGVVTLVTEKCRKCKTELHHWLRRRKGICRACAAKQWNEHTEKRAAKPT